MTIEQMKKLAAGDWIGHEVNGVTEWLKITDVAHDGLNLEDRRHVPRFFDWLVAPDLYPISDSVLSAEKQIEAVGPVRFWTDYFIRRGAASSIFALDTKTPDPPRPPTEPNEIPDWNLLADQNALG
jgi:hypothetical protein